MGLVGRGGQVGRVGQVGREGIVNFELDTSCKLAPAGGYHDHEIGHKFDRTPHFNAWSESTGTSSKKNVHLYYE